jgi:hypothetical protein
MLLHLVLIFYSPNSPPPGVKSLEPLIVRWWNWWTAMPAATALNWPQCIKGDGGKIGNSQSIVFLGNTAQAVDKNANARNQKCEISSNQLLYLTVYQVNVLLDQSLMKVNFPTQRTLLIF